MNSTTDLFIDGMPLIFNELSISENFESFCRFCSTHLQEKGRAIRAVHVDGIEVNCSTPPAVQFLRQARRIEVSSCLVEELLKSALDQQAAEARNLAREVAVLSTDCLIQTPRETFDKWRAVLENLKSTVGFIPKFVFMKPLAPSIAASFEENSLADRIQEIQEAVETSRRALESQDVVQFSDTLELRIVAWLKQHETLAQTVADSLHACSNA